MKSEQPDEALLFFRMWTSNRKGLRPNTVVYSTIIKGFALSKNAAKALEMYEEMKTAGGRSFFHTPWAYESTFRTNTMTRRHIIFSAAVKYMPYNRNSLIDLQSRPIPPWKSIDHIRITNLNHSMNYAFWHSAIAFFFC